MKSSNKVNRFPRSRRLHLKREFIKLRRSNYINSKYFLFFWQRSQDTRIGISISKKVGKAVLRNRIKRLLREAFRKNQSLVKGFYDMVFSLKQSAKGADFAGIKKALLQVWKRAGIVDEKDISFPN